MFPLLLNLRTRKHQCWDLNSLVEVGFPWNIGLFTSEFDPHCTLSRNGDVPLLPLWFAVLFSYNFLLNSCTRNWIQFAWILQYVLSYIGATRSARRQPTSPAIAPITTTSMTHGHIFYSGNLRLSLPLIVFGSSSSSFQVMPRSLIMKRDSIKVKPMGCNSGSGADNLFENKRRIQKLCRDVRMRESCGTVDTAFHFCVRAETTFCSGTGRFRTEEWHCGGVKKNCVIRVQVQLGCMTDDLNCVGGFPLPWPWWRSFSL